MLRFCFGACCLVVLAGCASAPRVQPSSHALVFLTRDGCVNTEAMRANLEGALDALKRSRDYQLIDADTLNPTDPRRGYGTPTILFNNRDLFGMPKPTATDPPT
jgi:hypothetical protein